MSERDDTRVERDAMGEVRVPRAAYYGATTQRAVLNFPIGGRPIPGRMVHALGWIKRAAAEINARLGLLDGRRAAAIVEAATEVATGDHDDQFVVDVFQTGSGTSSNMNANEVIANRAAELLGAARGDRGAVHPNDHVNLGQSSNDVIPTAIHLATLLAIRDELEPGLLRLGAALHERSGALWETIKTGRTHLQDATPIRLGQVFRGYEGQVTRGRERIRTAAEELTEVALGGTAVGTGLNTHPEFAGGVCERILADTGIEIRETENHFQAQSTLDAALAASGQFRSVAVSLSKIANDIRWMASGPRTGLGELTLPAVQPGSSIMPGKVNPVIAESLIQATAQVVAHDQALLQAAQGGTFELNTMMPLAGDNLVRAAEILGRSAVNFADRCVAGIEATERGPESVERGLATVTGLVPWIGYDRAAALAKEAARTGKTVREIARETTDLTDAQLEVGLDPAGMTTPGLGDRGVS